MSKLPKEVTQPFKKKAIKKALKGHYAIIDPKQYANLAEPMTPERAYDMEDVHKKMKNAKKGKISHVPFLEIRNDKNGAYVANHDGRHRAKALADLGYDEMIVSIKGDKPDSKEIRQEHTDKKSKTPKVYAKGGLITADPQYGSVSYYNDPVDPPRFADGGYGKRIDDTEKQRGFLGEIRMPNQRDVMTEYSVGMPNTDELFRPSIISGIHPADLNYLRETGEVPEDLYQASLHHAEHRIKEGKSPFWNPEQDMADGGRASLEQEFVNADAIPHMADGAQPFMPQDPYANAIYSAVNKPEPLYKRIPQAVGNALADEYNYARQVGLNKYLQELGRNVTADVAGQAEEGNLLGTVSRIMQHKKPIREQIMEGHKDLPISTFATEMVAPSVLGKAPQAVKALEGLPAGMSIQDVSGGGFYSPLQKFVSEGKITKAPKEQWMSYINANAPKGAKKEAQWASLDTLPEGSLSKEDVINHLQAKTPTFETIQNEQPKFHKYQLDGTSSNYKENLIQYQAPTRPFEPPAGWGIREQVQDNGDKKYLVETPTHMIAAWHDTPEEAQRAMQKALSSEMGIENPYRDLAPMTHWEDPNIMAHYRTNVRPVEGGGSSFHVEEGQSDWAQKARDLRQGKVDRAIIEGIPEEEANKMYPLDWGIKQDNDALSQARKDALEAYHQADADYVDALSNPHLYTKRKIDEIILNKHDAEQAFNDAQQALKDNMNKVNPNPYMDTQDYTDLIAKNAIKDAIEGGHDYITWTNGAQQANRYKLSNHVKELRVIPKDNTLTNQTYRGEPRWEVQATDLNGNDKTIGTFGPDKLSTYIGKDLANKVFKGDNLEYHPVTKYQVNYNGEGFKEPMISPINSLERAQQFVNDYNRDYARYVVKHKLTGDEKEVNGVSELSNLKRDYDSNNPNPSVSFRDLYDINQVPHPISIEPVEERNPMHKFTDLDKEVGGEGMRYYYDQHFLPKGFKNAFKTLGVEPEFTTVNLSQKPEDTRALSREWQQFLDTHGYDPISADELLADPSYVLDEHKPYIQDFINRWDKSMDNAESTEQADPLTHAVEQPAIKITPEMKDAYYEKGFPTFKRGGEIDNHEVPHMGVGGMLETGGKYVYGLAKEGIGKMIPQGGKYAKKVAHNTYEQVPYAYSGHLEGMPNQSFADKLSFTHEAPWDKNGTDLLSEYLGMPHLPSQEGVGLYKPPNSTSVEINPQVNTRNIVKPNTAKRRSNTMDDKSSADMSALGALRGYLDVQGASPWVRPSEGGKRLYNGFHIVLDGEPTPTEMAKIGEIQDSHGFNGASDLGKSGVFVGFNFDIGPKELAEIHPNFEADLRSALGDKLKGVKQVKTEGDYPGYENVFSPMKVGPEPVAHNQEGKGYATHKLLEYLDSASDTEPLLKEFYAQKPKIELQALMQQMNQRDEAAPLRYGVGAPRQDVMNARNIFADEGVEGLRKAFEQNKYLPSALLGVPLLDNQDDNR